MWGGPPGPRGTPTSRFLCFVRSLRMLKRPTRGSAADRGSAPQSAEQSQSESDSQESCCARCTTLESVMPLLSAREGDDPEIQLAAEVAQRGLADGGLPLRLPVAHQERVGHDASARFE